MHILHLIDSEGFYGAEKVVLGLAQECTRLGDRVTIGLVAAPNESNAPFEKAARQQHLPVARLALARGFSIGGIRRILEYARRESVDIIHSHSYKPNILLGCMPHRFRAGPIITTLHGRTSTLHLKRLLVYHYVERQVLKRLDAVVFVDKRSMQRSLSFVRRDSAFYIPNGIDCRKTQGGLFGDSKQYASDDRSRGVISLLAIGRLSPEKGFDLLLSALQQLRDGGHPVDLTIAGEGAERQRLLDQAADLGIQESLHLPGYQSDLSRLLRNADALVVPSRSEGLPLVVLEAMAMEVPVIATTVGEIPDVLDNGRAGTLIEPESVEAIVAAVIKHRTDAEAMRQRAAAAKVRVQTVYSSEAMARKYEEVYKAVSS